MAELNWSDAQWQKVNDAVTESFQKASVASALLPCYGPLAESTEYVRDEKFPGPPGPSVTVSDDTTLKLFNLTVSVQLSNEQVADESLSSALLAFRRAASTLAQVEDDIVFNGYDDTSRPAADNPRARAMTKGVAAVPTPLLLSVVANQPDSLTGLVHVDAKGVGTLTQIRTSIGKRSAKGDRGDHVVGEVAAAVVALEKLNHAGPFACVLGADVFKVVHTPRLGLLPADSIRPLLNGPLLRSGLMQNDSGIVASLAGANIDIVVATPPKVQFLQLDNLAKYNFRVYEKFILRIKDKTAVHGIGA
jgi:uncharacterized linocin/CFP29 family protein